MKFMKIALSVVAIAAIVTIYSTGAFVFQTPGMDNTVDGFLAISNAEMAQQVGGENDPSEGIAHYKEREDHGSFCSEDSGDCFTRWPGEENVKIVRNSYWMCRPCLPPTNINLFNLIVLNNVPYPKFSRLDENGADYEPTHRKLRLVCEEGEEGKCTMTETGIDGEWGNCLRWIGFCED